jgi:predicted RNase H-like nuclease (RuvC/YqgF family)
METNQPKKSGNNGLLGAGLAIMTAVAGILGYMLFDEKQVVTKQESEINLKVQELASTQTKLDSISTQLDERIAEVQKLGGDVSELMKVKEQLEADKASLRKNSRVSFAKYDRKIKEYETFLAQKDEEIAKLREENVALTGQNEQLTVQNTTLQTDLTTTRTAYNDSVTTLKTNNEELTSKVNLGAALRAENVKVYAINSRGKQKEDDAYKSKRVDQIKVAFALAPNPLTKEEPKDVFVRVVDPEGSVVTNSNNTGAFTYNGQEMVYTTKQQVTYSNNRPMVEVVYPFTKPEKKGKYNVELYAEGYKIGQGGFEVR